MRDCERSDPNLGQSRTIASFARLLDAASRSVTVMTAVVVAEVPAMSNLLPFSSVIS